MKKTKKLKKGDILLLLMYADEYSPIRGRTRLQKIIFVFENEIYKQYKFNQKLDLKTDGFGFRAHNFGPFSKQVFDLLELFVNIGMVEIKYDDNNIEEALKSIDDDDISCDDIRQLPDFEDDEISCGDHFDYIYSITPIGIKFVHDKLISYIEKEQIDALTRLKKTFNDYSLNNILKYVYRKYPDMTTESIIREKVLEETWQF